MRRKSGGREISARGGAGEGYINDLDEACEVQGHVTVFSEELPRLRERIDALRAQADAECGTKAKASRKNATRAKRGREGAKRTSCLDAAAQVLADADGPMNCKEMVEAMLELGLWQTDGKTPSATLYSAILRETQRKGEDSRFKKVGRGQFALAG